MIWLTRRQLRAQAAVVYGAVLVVVTLLLVSTRSTSDTTVYVIGAASVIALPALTGIFWGAPLIARELENGTHRLIWTQSISRSRWLTVKLGLGSIAVLAAAGVLSLVVTWWSAPIDAAINSGESFDGIRSVSRMQPLMFLARGVVPIGYAAFAFVLGATAGLLLRRTLPAMAVSLAVFVGVQVITPVVVRSHLAPEQLTTTITRDNLRGMIIGDRGDPVTEVRVEVRRPGAWITVNSPMDPSGELTDTLPGWARDCAPSPGGQSREQACFARLTEAGYRQRVRYQPRSRYWTFQAIETGLFLALAGVLAAVCFRRIRRVG